MAHESGYGKMTRGNSGGDANPQGPQMPKGQTYPISTPNSARSYPPGMMKKGNPPGTGGSRASHEAPNQTK